VLKIVPPSRKVMNLGHFLKQSADRFPDKPALIRGDAELSFRELNQRVDSICSAFDSMGVGKGDRILVQSRNSFAMFESMFVAFRLGAVLVPVNFRLSEDEVAFIAQNSGASVLIYEGIGRGGLFSRCCAIVSRRWHSSIAASGAGRDNGSSVRTTL